MVKLKYFSWAFWKSQILRILLWLRTLFYKELIRCHGDFVLDAWSFLIKNIRLPRNPLQKTSLSFTTKSDSLIFQHYLTRWIMPFRQLFLLLFLTTSLRKKKYIEARSIACLGFSWVYDCKLLSYYKGYIMGRSLVLKGRPNPPTGFLLAL